MSLFISIWAHAQHFLEMRSRRYRDVLFALFMGGGAVATMSLAFELRPGAQVDLRSSLVAIAGYFGGPLGALITGGLAGAYRLALGGEGALNGLRGIAVAAALGGGFHWLGRGKPPSIGRLFLLSLCIAGYIAANFIIAPPLVGSTVTDERFGPLFSALIFVTTFLSGFVLLRGRKMSLERSLLRAAVAQAPDYFYVKDTQSRFVAVNSSTAAFHGLAHPRELEGKTDFDVLPDQAQELFDAEQEIMRGGTSFADREEEVRDRTGETRWFSTSKSPLRDADGNIIGLVGITRDITERRRLETAAARNHSLLSFALTEMSDGLAMFDRDGYLVLRNHRYASHFPLTAHVRQPGTHIRTILQAVVDTGEQLHVTADDPQRWIDEIEASLKKESEEEVSLADGRWLQIHTRPTSEGSSLVVVSDVTTIKKAELELVGMTDKLRELATTDALTGLLNRRSFDQILDGELARTGRERQPLSLLMIDVDRFKAYNDRYGHQSGDRCLRLVANCLREAALRPGDSLARYGGEEFIAILPNTDEDGAFVLAERLRRGLRDLNLPHEGSEKGIVTVSVGIASYSGTESDRRDTELLRRADEALYDAKAAGRDRVTGWRGTHEVSPRRTARAN